MYTRYFGLSEKPFSITPDPHFLFLSDRHAEALAHLVYGVTESGGFIQLTGEVGTGKTTLTRCLLGRLPESVDLAVVLNPRLSVKEFLETIFDELHLDRPHRDATTKELVDALNVRLLESHARGRRTVLLVDEAQNLDTEVLEQLRLLTNLETSKEKLLQIILVGQPELRDTLSRNDLRQLAQRITGRYHLENLNPQETIAYVRHRLAVAGADREIFDNGALWEVHRLTDGFPRLINVICDRALLGAFSAESPTVTRKIVREAAAEVHGTAPPKTSRSDAAWLPKIAMTAAVLMMIGVAGWGIATLMKDSDGLSETAAVENADSSQLIEPAEAKTSSPEVRLAMAQTMNFDGAQSSQTRYESLTALLNDPSRDTSTDSAFSNLFELWGLTSDSDSTEPCRFARQQQLKCEFIVGSTRLLTSLNRPAILSLVDDGGQLHNAVVVSADQASLGLLIDGTEHRIGLADIARYWYGEFLILWKPQEGVDSLLLPGTRSDEVQWLRQSLADVTRTRDTAADPRYYDETLQQKVVRFQRLQGLEADGKVGLHTLIALNSALNVRGTPYIRTGVAGN